MSFTGRCLHAFVTSWQRPRVLVASLPALLLAFHVGGASAQDDPVRGTWRGTLRSAQTTESPISITIVRKGDGYEGFTTGIGESNPLPLKRVVVAGNRVSLEAAADSQLGNVVLAGELTVEGTAMKGTGTLAVGPHQVEIALQLQRRPRQDVIQPQVEQRLDYFVGRWSFEYVGGDFPPLSPGTRGGTVMFSRSGTSSFVMGQVQGEISGEPYKESLSIGFDPEANALVFLERRPNGAELVSVANWQSPLAIRFTTAPVEANGRTYQLRRLMSIRSDSAFDVTEEFSVDGGPYRRLGNARFTRLP